MVLPRVLERKGLSVSSLGWTKAQDVCTPAQGWRTGLVSDPNASSPVGGACHHSTNASFLIPSLSSDQRVCFPVSFLTNFSPCIPGSSLCHRPQESLFLWNSMLYITGGEEMKGWGEIQSWNFKIYSKSIRVYSIRPL